MSASLSRPMSSVALITSYRRRLALLTCHTGLSLLFEVGARPSTHPICLIGADAGQVRSGDAIDENTAGVEIARPRVWPDTFVDEGNLRFQVATLRKALGDGRGGNRFIANIPGRGYTFVAPVTREHAHADNAWADGPALPDKPSLAVLPFQNMSGDAEQEYFVDGMVEEITTAIARLPWLFVIARNSAFTYKGKPVGVKQVAQELGV